MNVKCRMQSSECRRSIPVWLCILHSAFCIAAAAHAQIVASTPKGIVVAHDGIVELPGAWSTPGVQTPEAVASSKDQIAILDPLANEARIVELATGRGKTVRTGETPIAGIFIGRALYLLERDARALERIGADGTRASISIHADPAFLRERNGTLYVYDRATGLIDEITTQPFAVRRTAKTAAFGSDFEIDGRNAYIVQPRSGKMAVVTLATMKAAGSFDVGAVPVDLDITSSGTALTASTLAIADPAMKKVWITEGAQSTGQAFLRGFFRALRQERMPRDRVGCDRRGRRRAFAWQAGSGPLGEGVGRVGAAAAPLPRRSHSLPPGRGVPGSRRSRPRGAERPDRARVRRAARGRMARRRSPRPRGARPPAPRRGSRQRSRSAERTPLPCKFHCQRLSAKIGNSTSAKSGLPARVSSSMRDRNVPPRGVNTASLCICARSRGGWATSRTLPTGAEPRNAKK